MPALAAFSRRNLPVGRAGPANSRRAVEAIALDSFRDSTTANRSRHDHPRFTSWKTGKGRPGRLHMSSQRTRNKDDSNASGQDASVEEVEDQFRSLMEGLRTTIPGVMVLFSFLLLLPLQTPFADISDSNRWIFYVAFVCSALASILLIAPSVHQRVRAPLSGIKRTTMGHVMAAAWLAIAGSIAFLIAICAVVYLVSSLVFADSLAIIAAVVITAVSGWAWLYLPLIRFRSDSRGEAKRAG